MCDDGIRSIADLKGRSVGVGSSPRALFELMAAQVGLDSRKDFRWISDQSLKPLELFVDGKIDSFFGAPPEPQELRARRAGHVIFICLGLAAVPGTHPIMYCCICAGPRRIIANESFGLAVRQELKRRD